MWAGLSLTINSCLWLQAQASWMLCPSPISPAGTAPLTAVPCKARDFPALFVPPWLGRAMYSLLAAPDTCVRLTTGELPLYPCQIWGSCCGLCAQKGVSGVASSPWSWLTPSVLFWWLAPLPTESTWFLVFSSVFKVKCDNRDHYSTVYLILPKPANSFALSFKSRGFFAFFVLFVCLTKKQIRF